MARYRFHCTNGTECVFDARGVVVRRPDALGARARRVADGVMRSLGRRADWAEWRVTVHDLTGRRVLLQRFPTSGEAARAA
ncbi:hypothetical protein J2X36_004959 [Methylobacterium sp. BE186]|uniref:DUF6894 family protein n=1 Tax=Methylobacterium sp. BE186 TaxID=2817715 RepID=UPI00285DF801|nr:hypothetical protein [Methylobacterium sp. BE186]MDR7040178.1 hypothetical protein [Methylobacterium sp. BE186]